MLKNGFGFVKNLSVPESQHFEALCLQPLITVLIRFGCRVLTTINFNNQLCFEANEICDVRSDRMLATEAIAVESHPA